MLTSKNTKKTLSIQFALDGFSFLIYNSEKLKIILEKEIAYPPKEKFYNWLKVKLAGEKALRQAYHSTKILYTPDKQTLVPNQLIEKDREKDLFTISFPLKDNEMIESEKIGENTLFSSISEEIYNLIDSYFPKAKWKTTTSLLIEQIQDEKEWNIGVLLIHNCLNITVKKEGKVQLCNCFYFYSKDDLLFYILYAFDNLDIPIGESSIQLWGNNAYVKVLKEDLERYHPLVKLQNNFARAESKIPLGNLLLSNL